MIDIFPIDIKEQTADIFTTPLEEKTIPLFEK